LRKVRKQGLIGTLQKLLRQKVIYKVEGKDERSRKCFLLFPNPLASKEEDPAFRMEQTIPQELKDLYRE
tara:strand:- start:1633 stop:1839 length:207 start_codon:yes stop_codon:yes gene_type:complete